MSSQFVSSVLLSAPFANKPMVVELVEQGRPTSSTYIDMTVSCMRMFGVDVVKSVSEEGNVRFEVPTMQSMRTGAMARAHSMRARKRRRVRWRRREFRNASSRIRAVLSSCERPRRWIIQPQVMRVCRVCVLGSNVSATGTQPPSGPLVREGCGLTA